MWLKNKGDEDVIKQLELDTSSLQDTETPVSDEDYEHKDEHHHEVSLDEIAQMVHSFYDSKTGKFPIGEHGVLTKVKKELGDDAGSLAEKLISRLSQRYRDPEPAVDQQAFEDILRLSGLKK